MQPRCELHGVDNHAVVVLPFKKDEVTLTHETAAELLHLIVTPERQPVYVHCLDGVTATGTLVMCLRKLQRWALPPIVAEYTRFDRRRGDQPWQPEPQHGQKCRRPPLAAPQLGCCVPPQGTTGGSEQLGTPRERPVHRAPSHCLGCSS